MERTCKTQARTSVLLALLALGAVVGCQEVLDVLLDRRPPTISNLRTTWRSLNSCGGQPPGSVLLVTFQFSDPDTTVANGNTATAAGTWRPSGSTFENRSLRTTIRGTGHSGEAEYTHCLRFGQDTLVDYSVTLTDSNGAESNSLSTSILRPQGANLEVDAATGVPRQSTP